MLARIPSYLEVRGPFSKRRNVEANLTRILIHAGRSVDPATIGALEEEIIETNTRFTLFMLMRPEEESFSKEMVDLALLPRLSEARNRGKGVVLALAHFGLINQALQALWETLRWNMIVPDFQPLAQFPPEVRERTIPVGSGAERAVAALARNEVVVVVTDVNLMPKKLKTLFFGAPASLGYGAAKLALASEATLLPAYAIALDGGKRCRFEADELIIPLRGKESLVSLNERLARSMERYIGRYPGQWNIVYDFWKMEKPPSKYRMSWPVSSPDAEGFLADARTP